MVCRLITVYGVLKFKAFMEGKDVPLCYSATVTGNSQVVTGTKQGQRIDLSVHLGKKLVILIAFFGDLKKILSSRIVCRSL